MLQFWVYILRCRDGSYYTGHTDDLQARLWQHHQGLGADWTRRRRPVELAWCELMPSRDDAFAAERRIKNWSRAKKEALIAGDWERVGYFARPPHERPSTEFILSDAAGGDEGLGTNEVRGLQIRGIDHAPNPDSFVPSGGRSAAEAAVEGRGWAGGKHSE